jgi:hypothetical protein
MIMARYLNGFQVVCLALFFAMSAPMLFAAVDDEKSSNLTDMSVDEIAKELSNPVTALATFDFDLEFRGYQGSLPDADDQSTYIYKFRPSFPIPLDNGKNILMSMTIPIYGNQPLYFVDEVNNVQLPEWRVRQLADTLPTDRRFTDGHDHIADIEFDIAYGGVSDSGFISMYGIATVLPTSQDLSSGIDQIQLGPEVAFGKVTPWGVFGAKATHVTGVAGDDGWDTNMTSLEVFFAYGLNNGWQLFSNPVIQYDWEAASDNKLFVPIGGGVSKTMKLGKMPLKLGLELQYYVVTPDSLGPQWLLTFNAIPVFRNPFQK